MQKVSTIEFEVFADQGEVPFRSYASSEPVSGNMFVLISKITGDNNVFFKLFTCDIKTGETTCRVERTTTMEKFQESVRVLEADLQKANADVTLVQQNQGEGFMIGQQGPMGQIPQGFGSSKGFSVDSEKMQKIVDLKKRTQSGEITPIDMIVEMIEGQLFAPEDLAGLISTLPIEAQLELANRLATTMDFSGVPAELQQIGNGLLNGLKGALAAAKQMKDAEKHMENFGKANPSARVNKHL